MLVSRSIPNLVNGVSQQPDSLRLPTQAEVQENLYSSVVEGLKDRPPTQHITQLYAGAIGDAYGHTINRDSSERYQVLFRNGDLTVHDMAGNAKTVTFPDGKTYLNTLTPKSSIKAITVADYTFIVNLEKTIAMAGTTTSSRLHEALIFVKQGAYGSDYKVFIDGVQRGAKTTSTTVVTDIATDAIAEDLRSDLATWGGASYTVARYGSVVHIQKVSGDFKITCSDSQGGASLAVFKDSVQSFTMLPTTAPTDFMIKINGQPESSADDYYVKFVPATSGETFGEGSWQETIQGGLAYEFDASTMPHALIRNVDGTFTFQEIDWSANTVGDDTTNPQPSFVGEEINDVFFFKNRLCFLSKDNIICSQVAEYFNFWRTTVTTVRDDDRIDYTVSHTKVAILNHAIPFDEKVVLFSDLTQFIMQGGEVFSQKTIKVDPVTEFENSKTCKPIQAGRYVYFVTPNGQYNGMREFFVDQTTDTKDAQLVTSHVPKYIPSGAFKLATSSTEDVVLLMTTGDTPSIYAYKFFRAGEEKLQSSWSRFILGDDANEVLSADFIEGILYLVIQRTDGVYFEKADFSPGATDPDVNFVTHYDRRITEAECSVSYNAGLNQTTWTLPYQIDGTMAVVTRETDPGQQITLTYQSGSTIKCSGDKSATQVYIGQTYTRTYEFSKIFLREQGQNGSNIILVGRLQLRYGVIAYAGTGTFTVTVTQDYRDPNSYVNYQDPTDAIFTGRILGAGSNLLGAVALATGEFRFPILSQNTKCRIVVTSDSFLPMRLLSMDWEGLFHAHSRRG